MILGESYFIFFSSSSLMQNETKVGLRPSFHCSFFRVRGRKSLPKLSKQRTDLHTSETYQMTFKSKLLSDAWHSFCPELHSSGKVIQCHPKKERFGLLNRLEFWARKCHSDECKGVESKHGGEDNQLKQKMSNQAKGWVCEVAPTCSKRNAREIKICVKFVWGAVDKSTSLNARSSSSVWRR